jgi:hypothetical protein
VAGEDEELRNVLLIQGALVPLARMMLPYRRSTVRTAAWALSNLIKVSNPSNEYYIQFVSVIDLYQFFNDHSHSI